MSSHNHWRISPQGYMVYEGRHQAQAHASERHTQPHPHWQFLRACLLGAKLSGTDPLHPKPNKHKCPLFKMAQIPWYLQATKSLKSVLDLWGSTSTGLRGWLLRCCSDQRQSLVKGDGVSNEDELWKWSGSSGTREETLIIDALENVFRSLFSSLKEKEKNPPWRTQYL